MLCIVVLSTMVMIINPFIVSSPTGLRHMNDNYRKLLLKNLPYKTSINTGRQINKILWNIKWVSLDLSLTALRVCLICWHLKILICSFMRGEQASSVCFQPNSLLFTFCINLAVSTMKLSFWCDILTSDVRKTANSVYQTCCHKLCIV